MSARKKFKDDDFYAGMIAALAVVVVYDQETLYREIVATADEEALVAFARRDGAMEFSGLTKYGYGKRKQPQ